jgi:acetoin utilization protein AcuB
MTSSHTVGMYMTRSPVTVERTTTMGRALRIMEDQGFRHLPVVDGGRLVGLVSERELKIVEHMQGVDSAMCVVGDFILGPPFHVAADANLRDVARAMAEKKFGSAVVVDGEQVVGVFTTTDALKALAIVLGA